MPELPDLEVIKESLQRTCVGRRIETVLVPRPLVVRVVEPGITPESFLQGRTLTAVERAGKLLLLIVEGPRHVVINCMLAGRLRLAPHAERVRTRDYLILGLDDGCDLRYHDVKGMGKIYLTTALAQVPGYAELGPDALDPALTPDVFLARLRRHPGEIKGVLTRGRVVAGIGNAYADEILFHAGIYPFRPVSSLSESERRQVYDSLRAVLDEAIVVLRERVGDDIENEVRDWLQVHGKGGQPCPRCGHTISEVTGAGHVTHFCRHCQPGSLLRGSS